MINDLGQVRMLASAGVWACVPRSAVTSAAERPPHLVGSSAVLADAFAYLSHVCSLKLMGLKEPRTGVPPVAGTFPESCP